jgi:tetratricopeptide (TPR) repeat protein
MEIAERTFCNPKLLLNHNVKMSRLAGLFILLTVVQFSYAQSNKDKAMNNVKQALLFENKGKMDEAIKLLEEARNLDPETINVSYELAIAYYTRNDYEKAKTLLESLLTRKDVFGTIYQVLGNCYDKLGKPDKAIEIYENGLKKFPNTAELYLELGTMHLAKKEYDKALGQYEKGIEVNPGFASNYYWAAKIFCNSDEAVWGMLYGEIFLNLERTSKRTDEISKLLYDTYKKQIRFAHDSSFSVHFTKNALERLFDTTHRDNTKIPFAKSVYEPTLMLALINEKTVDVNSLCRARKYFVESYFRTTNYLKYPNVVFDFQYRVLKAGHIDAYNHWVLYKGDEGECNKWITANSQKWDNFIKWFSSNLLLLDSKYKFYRKQYE